MPPPFTPSSANQDKFIRKCSPLPSPTGAASVPANRLVSSCALPSSAHGVTRPTAGSNINQQRNFCSGQWPAGFRDGRCAPDRKTIARLRSGSNRSQSLIGTYAKLGGAAAPPYHPMCFEVVMNLSLGGPTARWSGGHGRGEGNRFTRLQKPWQNGLPMRNELKKMHQPVQQLLNSNCL